MKVNKSWGYYEVLYTEDHICIKILNIYPNKSISVQYHNHREETWRCLKGTGELLLGTSIINISAEAPKWYLIPQREIHSVTNVGTDILRILEIQTGEYIGEDDIIRVIEEEK